MKFSGGTYDHRCRRNPHSPDDFPSYYISWTQDMDNDDRFRYPIRRSSVTDKRGARRFCKRHGLPFPDQQEETK